MDKLTDKNDNGHPSRRVKDSVMDKVQKLTGALYRVTALYPDKEPLKWELRNNAVELYANLMSIMSVNLSPRQFEETIVLISRVIHILGLASLEGFISDINFEILKKEYEELKALLEGRKDDFISEQKLLVEPEPASAKPGTEVEKDFKPRGKSAKGRKKALNGEFSGRKEKILNFLKKNGKKTIKEISAIFEEVGDKTIQRYLLDLVKSGEIKAEGEKRWRVYSLTESRK